MTLGCQRYVAAVRLGRTLSYARHGFRILLCGVQFMLYEGSALTDEQMDEMRNSGIGRPNNAAWHRLLRLRAKFRLELPQLSIPALWWPCRRLSGIGQQSA